VTPEERRRGWKLVFSLACVLAGGPGCEFFAGETAAASVDAGGMTTTASTTTASTTTGTPAVQTDDGGQRSLWVDLYYTGWRANRLPPEALDLSGVTHVIHFAWLPWVVEGGTDVIIDDTTNGVDAAAAAALVQVVHAAGKKVLISVGGAGKGSTYFAAAMADANRAAFIDALIAKTVERGYDGIDIDWEPGWDQTQQGIPAFQIFSRDLRTAIGNVAPHLLLTTAGLGASSKVFGAIASVYDQINIMTYDLVYGVSLTWHNSAISGGTGAYYSIDRAGSEYVRDGVPKGTVGIGLKCSGFSWLNATAPMQNPMGATPRSVPYTSIMASSFTDAVYRWDDQAEVPYLSIMMPAPTFITYDDARSAKAKIDFIRTARYGGLIIWDSSDQYFPAGDPSGEKNPLLQAVKEAVATP